jgi:molecular chaperone GrpE
MTDPAAGTHEPASTADQVRDAYSATDAEPVTGPVVDDGATTPPHGDELGNVVDPADAAPGAPGSGPAGGESAAEALAQERLADLQRLQAEFVNYRRRVERDRDVARDVAVAGVLEALLPVLDDLHLARQHGDLEGGPFAAIADKLEATLGRYGLARYGGPGETFDPTVHEALVRTEADLAEGTTDTTVVQVLQPGYRLSTAAGDKVLRAARVAVADPR